METIYWTDGKWSQEATKTAGPGDLGLWAGTSVFDGARSINGCVPDLDRHCERLVTSARNMLMEPELDAEEIEALCREGLRQLPEGKDYYIRPVFHVSGGLRLPESGKTVFSLAIFEAAMPVSQGFRSCLSRYRRPTPLSGPTDAKAGALYPVSQHAQKEAVERGFDLAVMLDEHGDVAEFNYANLWLVRDGVAMTPAPNGCFLNGITRQRVMSLLAEAGQEVCETRISPEDLTSADEIFSTGNLRKVSACIGYEERALQPGPVFRTARALYDEFTATCPL